MALQLQRCDRRHHHEVIMSKRWRGKVRRVTLALFSGCVFAATAANANGRFPRAEHLIEDPSDHNRLTIAATYGILTTDNGGVSWYYTCEQAFSLFPSPPGYLGDPELALMPDGALLAGVQARLTMSVDRACGWRSVLENPKMFIGDFAVAPSNRNIVVALARTLVSGGSQIQLQQSTDGGRTWKVVGVPLPIALDYTVDVDPTNPEHIYATGITNTSGDNTGVLLSSTNLGATWTAHPIPNTSIEAAPYIARIHPSDPSKVFVRTDEWVDSQIANDALLYTDDGGANWTELLRAKGDEGGAKLFAFALSPDGSTVLAGYGDPVEGGGRLVDKAVMGVYKSTGPGYSFGATPTPTFAESVSCLEWTATGVYVCGAPEGKVSYVGFAKDVAMVTAAGLTTIMHTDQIKGDPPCCKGGAVSSCNWADDCQRLGACGDAGTSEVDASCGDAGADPGKPEAGGAGGGSSGSGGSAGAGGSAGTGGPTAGTAGSEGSSSASCQCDLGATRGSPASFALSLALASLATACRRRRARNRRPE